MKLTMVGKYDLKGEYHLDAAKIIKPHIGDIPLLLVGGVRKVKRMNEILEQGQADFISMSRPFIRQPNLVNLIKEGKLEEVDCVSCNKCFANAAQDNSIRCFAKDEETK